MKKLSLVMVLALATCKPHAPAAPVQPSPRVSPSPQVSPPNPVTPAPKPKPKPVKPSPRVGPSCDDQNYRFQQNSVRMQDRPIHVVTYRTLSALSSAYAALHNGRALDSDQELFGFTVISSSQCTIHIIDPAVRYCPTEFGHEMTHCLYGQFHNGEG